MKTSLIKKPINPITANPTAQEPAIFVYYLLSGLEHLVRSRLLSFTKFFRPVTLEEIGFDFSDIFITTWINFWLVGFLVVRWTRRSWVRLTSLIAKVLYRIRLIDVCPSLIIRSFRVRRLLQLRLRVVVLDSYLLYWILTANIVD